MRRPTKRARTCRTLLLVLAALAAACAPARPSIRESPAASAIPPPADPATAGAADAAAPEASPAIAPGSQPEPEPPDPLAAERTRLRERILEAARRLLGHRGRLDCSGYVLAAYGGAGLRIPLAPARTRSQALLSVGREVSTPEPGDLAFFRDTTRSRKRPAGSITHVAVVEQVDGSSFTLLHRGRHRVERFRMDLERPSDPERNDPLRVRRPQDPPRTRYLAGELFAAFGALLDGAVTQSLQASRAGDTDERQSVTRW